MKKSGSNTLKKVLFFLALLIARNVAKEAIDVNAAKKEIEAEEVEGKILFDPKLYLGSHQYLLDTNGDGIADKTMEIGHAAYGGAMETLSNYLVRGAKIVYENDGMKNVAMEFVGKDRFIGLVTVDGIYIELTQLLSPYQRGYMPSYLYEKLKREGRTK